MKNYVILFKLLESIKYEICMTGIKMDDKYMKEEKRTSVHISYKNDLL